MSNVASYSDKVYMILIKPADEAEDEFEEESWQGRINKITETTRKLIRSLEGQMKRNLNE